MVVVEGIKVEVARTQQLDGTQGRPAHRLGRKEMRYSRVWRRVSGWGQRCQGEVCVRVCVHVLGWRPRVDQR